MDFFLGLVTQLGRCRRLYEVSTQRYCSKYARLEVTGFRDLLEEGLGQLIV